ncbi:hypothetical protein HYT55_05945 [Candidatus Woesearchaeota archaeon]|nr:hypothetical protein [Candidatus Woesearchaeota archaeon]
MTTDYKQFIGLLSGFKNQSILGDPLPYLVEEVSNSPPSKFYISDCDQIGIKGNDALNAGLRRIPSDLASGFDSQRGTGSDVSLKEERRALTEKALAFFYEINAAGSFQMYRTAEQREEVFKVAKTLGDFVLEHDIRNVLFLDRSARAAHVALREYLRVVGASEHPQTYFLNPKVLKDILHYDRSTVEFERTYRRLVASRTDPTLIFDTCAHSGLSLLVVQTLLKISGFSRIYTGTVSKADRESLVHPDFHVVERSSLSCQPFGGFMTSSNAVRNVSGSLLSQRETDPRSLQRAARVRQEIKQIVRENSSAMVETF